MNGHLVVRYYSFVVAIVLSLISMGLFCWEDYILPSKGTSQTLTIAINPNTAEIPSLIRLPGIGPARARDIVEYRNSPDIEKPAFKCAADLEKIKGIGPKTAEKIGPYLCFD